MSLTILNIYGINQQINLTLIQPLLKTSLNNLLHLREWKIHFSKRRRFGPHSPLT